MSESNAKKRTNLKKLLNRSSEDEEESSDKSTSSNASKKSTSSSVGSQRAKQSNKTKTKPKEVEKNEPKKSSSVLLIPDTCFYGSEFENVVNGRQQAPSKIKPASRITIIRDTIESNDEILEPFTSNKNQAASNMMMSNLRDENQTCIEIDRTYVPDTMADHLENQFRLASKLDHLAQNDKQSSTPLAVKRQLQEHGLLDLTNSPCRTQEVQTSSSCEPSPISKIPPNVPVVRDAQASSNLGNPKKGQTAKTPVKVIELNCN